MEVTCKFENRYWWKGEKYSCVVGLLSSLTVTKPGTEVKSISGVHETVKASNDAQAFSLFSKPGVKSLSHNDVEGLWIEQAIVEYIPKGLKSIFPSLVNLAVFNCGLKEISRRDLIGLEGLENLDLGNNLLTALPNDLFVNMTKLKFISVQDNKLETVTSRILEPIMANLEYANFKGNNPNMQVAHFEKGGPVIIEDLMKAIDDNFKPPADTRKVNLNAVVKNLRKLFISERNHDVVVRTETGEIKAHRLILGANSSVLEAILSRMDGLRKNEIKIFDFSAGAVKDLINFFYTGEVESSEHSMDLFGLAVKYDVPDLKTMCEEMISENIDELNALEVFNLGHLHASYPLKRAAFAQIEAMLPGEQLDDRLINDPETLYDLVNSKRRYDVLMNRCRRK